MKTLGQIVEEKSHKQGVLPFGVPHITLEDEAGQKVTLRVIGTEELIAPNGAYGPIEVKYMVEGNMCLVPVEKA